MSEVPEFAESLFSVPAEDFVAERKRIAGNLRDEGRTEDAAAVAALRKPPPVVLAANRAARSRPKVAKAAARAASRVAKQVGDVDARRELDDQLTLLEEVALAFLDRDGSAPSEATRRRLRDLLRNAAADDEAREALARGVLPQEPEPAGFAAYAAMPQGASRARSAVKGAAERMAATSRAAHAEAKRREHERVLREEVDAAEKRLVAARDAEAEAAQERARLEKELASARKKLDRLSRR